MGPIEGGRWGATAGSGSAAAPSGRESLAAPKAALAVRPRVSDSIVTGADAGAVRSHKPLPKMVNKHAAEYAGYDVAALPFANVRHVDRTFNRLGLAIWAKQGTDMSTQALVSWLDNWLGEHLWRPLRVSTRPGDYTLTHSPDCGGKLTPGSEPPRHLA